MQNRPSIEASTPAHYAVPFRRAVRDFHRRSARSERLRHGQRARSSAQRREMKSESLASYDVSCFVGISRTALGRKRMDKPRIFLGSSGQQEKLLQALT